jgi:phage FluMu protein Com
MIRSVFCPCCNKRLFDAAEGDRANIQIRCPKCKSALAMDIDDKYITEEIRMNPHKPTQAVRPPQTVALTQTTK